MRERDLTRRASTRVLTPVELWLLSRARLRAACCSSRLRLARGKGVGARGMLAASGAIGLPLRFSRAL